MQEVRVSPDQNSMNFCQHKINEHENKFSIAHTYYGLHSNPNRLILLFLKLRSLYLIFLLENMYEIKIFIQKL